MHAAVGELICGSRDFHTATLASYRIWYPLADREHQGNCIHWPAAREFARVEVFVENGRGSSALFDRSRCLPAWPSYFESVTPVREHFTFADDGAMVAGDAGLGDSESNGRRRRSMPPQVGPEMSSGT
eukprot:SAG22_NODE_3935_length_1462_cov_2.920763_3_plen_128_part_00